MTRRQAQKDEAIAYDDSSSMHINVKLTGTGPRAGRTLTSGALLSVDAVREMTGELVLSLGECVTRVFVSRLERTPRWRSNPWCA